MCAHSTNNDPRPTTPRNTPQRAKRAREHKCKRDAPPLNQARRRAARRDRRPRRYERLQALNARTHTQRFAYNLPMTARPNEQRAHDELARAPAPHIPDTAAPRFSPRRRDGRSHRPRDRKTTRERTCTPRQTNRAERNAAAASVEKGAARQRARAPPTTRPAPPCASYATRKIDDG